jgi:hypothetical protein
VLPFDRVNVAFLDLSHWSYQYFIPKVGGNHIRRNNILMYLGIVAENLNW